MGLDMYLRASKYVSGWEHGGKESKAQYAHLLQQIGLPDNICPESPSATINVTVAYWRKANAIHKWFVDNCQDGKDECQDSYVKREQLVELRDLCKSVLNDISQADGKLPPQSGFFFGSTTIDNDYKEDLGGTISQLNRILDDERLAGFSFIYHSSW
jgi:hypothetical protein